MDDEELCYGRVRYVSAKAARKEFRKKDHAFLCNVCFGWHVGYKPKVKPLKPKKLRYVDEDFL